MSVFGVIAMIFITGVAVDFGFRIWMYSKTREYKYKHEYRWWK